MDQIQTDKINSFLKLCGIENKDTFIEKCSTLKDFLYEENSKYNLTRIKDDFEFWNKHVADSASIGIYFAKQILASKRIADIGCGAGFPSIILSIMYPEQQITAIDSTGKKTNFVKMTSKALNLKNLEVITGRSNELKIACKFDLITARAVAEPTKIFRESHHLLSYDGNFILYQTPSEITTHLSAINKFTANDRFKWSIVAPFQIPGGENRIFLYSNRK